MIVIPAIDLKDGLCVRLTQGKKEESTTYSDDPARTARRWVSEGAELIHIVDLDGAFTGVQKNIESIKKIRAAVDVALETGGGIRNIERVTQLISLGIDRIIIGTAAVEDPDFLKRACQQYPGRIFVGIDAKNGMVAVRGWEEMTALDALDTARIMQGAGAAGIIYTDISRDGMLTGPNVEATTRMVKSVNIPVIASGGISSMDDIKRLMTVSDLYGAITGKAVYSGALNLSQAIGLARSGGMN